LRETRGEGLEHDGLAARTAPGELLGQGLAAEALALFAAREAGGPDVEVRRPVPRQLDQVPVEQVVDGRIRVLLSGGRAHAGSDSPRESHESARRTAEFRPGRKALPWYGRERGPRTNSPDSRLGPRSRELTL